MRIDGYKQLLAAWLSATIILKTSRAVDVEEESSKVCMGAAGSVSEETGKTRVECGIGASPSSGVEVGDQSVHELGIDNFESVVGTSPWTFVLLYDRLDLQSKGNNDMILEKLASKFASRKLPELSFAKMDIRQHGYFRDQFMDYEGGKGHFVHKFYNLTGPDAINSTTFMSMADEHFYWPSQWTLFGSDFNVYGVMPLDQAIASDVESVIKVAESWLMPLAGKLRPGVLMYSVTNNERYWSEMSAENADNSFTFSGQLCEDGDDDCAYWAAQGMCDSTEYSGWMQMNCRKSCGVCDDSNDTEDVASDEGELTTAQRYTTGSDEENQGDGFYTYKGILSSSLVDMNTSGLINQLSMLINRYLTWCVSYEVFWDEERKQREDRQTNYGFYLNKMNFQVKELVGVRRNSSIATQNTIVEPLDRYYQEMLFGYGRSYSTLQKYLEDEILDKLDPDIKSIDSVDMAQFALLNRIRELMRFREESMEGKDQYDEVDMAPFALINRIREFMRFGEESMEGKDLYKEYFKNMLTKLSTILREFHENLNRHYLNYRKTNKVWLDDFKLQRMDVLDMHDPKEFSLLSSYDEFERRYTAQRRPVVLANADMMDQNYTFDFLVEKCGHVDVTDNVQVSVPVGGRISNKEWGGLTKYSLDKALMNRWREENGYDESLTLEQFLILSKELDNLYLHDFTLMGVCDRLFHENTLYDGRQLFRLPSVIGEYDLFQKLTYHSYQLSWPSLFIGRKGSNSKVHVDSGASGFSMYLVSGRKRWVVFDAAERPFLYERMLEHSFIPDVLGLNKNDEANQFFDERFPLLRRAAESGYEVIQEPGQLVYIPPNTPHAVENLEDSVGVSLNFMPRFGVPHYLHDLILHSWKSPLLELTLRYMMLEGDHNKLVESVDPLYTTLAEYKSQL